MSETAIHFTVPLRAAPQGSKTLGRYGQLYESSKRVKPYREALALLAKEAMRGKTLLEGPLELHATFVFARGKNTCKYPLSRRIGDLSKLVRATEDALTGIVYADDSQIVRFGGVEKIYGVADSVVVTVKAV